jgi:hypothetical protein
MSYTTGTLPYLESRMHQLSQNSGDLNSYALEAQNNYTLTPSHADKLNKEFHKIMLSVHNVVETGKHF